MTPSLCRTMRLALLFCTLGWPVNAGDSIFSDSLLRRGQVQTVLEHQPVKAPSCEKTVLTGPIETTLCDYESMESVNEELFGNLSELVHMPFFRYFQVDLYRECPFWPDHGSCSDPGCAITTVDENDVPEKWRAKTLSEVDPASIDQRHALPGCYYRDSDFCFLDDHTEGDYFDLRLVPERYTGYSGKDAQRVWRTIYEENCFGLSERNLMVPAPVSLPDSMAEALHEGNEESEPQCLEKRVYYKVISGLHASISTHICHEYLDQTTGEWRADLQCFINRVASYPERLKYIYFNTILLLRAVARLEPYLKAFDYCSSGTHEDDARTLETLSRVLNIAKNVGRFDETQLFRGENANIVKEEFKTHFRNVTRIMDCIGCDKCRLWGKVQTTGIATALKVLFELDEKALDPRSNTNLLQRSEVVALMNTLYRFSESLDAVENFRRMWRELDESISQKIASSAEASVAAHANVPRADKKTILDTACDRLRDCKESIEENVTTAMNALGEAVNSVMSALRPSGKEQGPGQYDEL